MSDILLCVDCKHSRRAWHDVLLFNDKRHSLLCKKAHRPAETTTDLVVGPKKTAGYYQRCCEARGSWADAVCGADAKLWAPKSKQGLFQLIKKESY